MDIASYLREQSEELGKQTSRVRDFSVFDFNHVPKQPVMRDECKELIRDMLQFDLSGIPNHVSIIGSRGSGKTVFLRFLQQVMPEQTGLVFHYGNCRSHNTSARLFAQFLGVNARGSSLSELYERFISKCMGKTVVVLDEVDLMSPKDRRREILYLLSRSEKPFMVVMLSNSPQVLRELDAATRSSLQPVPLHFRNYSPEQLQEILRQRATVGLTRWDEGELAQIAALTVKLANSDARVAIKTLKYSVTGPSGSLTDAFERARRDVVIDLISDLSDPNLLILSAASSSRTDFAKDIYQRYCRLSEKQHEQPYSYVHFHAQLAYLQSVGLIALISTKQGRTYANRVVLTFDRQVLKEICDLRFSK
jgi:Cdc6-like AAA superfamily ATPase